MPTKQTRRQFVAATGALGIAAIAGCADTGGSGDEMTDEESADDGSMENETMDDGAIEKETMDDGAMGK